MRFYNNSHKHYCGVDLHTKTLYLSILDSSGKILMRKNIPVNGDFGWRFWTSIDLIDLGLTTS